ncbi:MAG: hypothetical protein FD127_588 [Acidimicrobiaceae bacterium]|nr:MAG: hypothetical protein FD127_588 [Acidimicrobiaceae bacterium]
MRYDRIAVDHRIMGGVPCIAGTRIPVATLVSMIAEGMTADEIIEDFPQLGVDDVRQALQFAAEAVRERELPLRASA